MTRSIERPRPWRCQAWRKKLLKGVRRALQRSRNPEESAAKVGMQYALIKNVTFLRK
jgi:hypothetical protein